MIDLIGQRFGRLIVIKHVGINKWKNSTWLCQCDCGKKKTICGNNLRRKVTQSCGCLQVEGIAQRSTKHGHNKRGKTTRTYRSWMHIIQRCTNPNNEYYYLYGGRGIKICRRWMKFENFLEDMGESPGFGYSIDRINNNQGYYKENCRWTTPKEQQRNTRDNHLETYNGKTQCIAAWAEEYNIPYTTLWNRLYTYGWSIEKAVTIPVKAKKINE